MTLTQTRQLRPGSESGQATVFVLIALGLFLLGMIAFAVDFTNLWFRRQAAQSAADSACVAGIMDVLALANGASINPHFTPGTNFSCSATYPNNTTAAPTPCWYANANGFTSPGLGAASPADVAVSFPGSVSGVTAPSPSSIAPYPFIQVVTTQDVKVFFAGLFSGQRTQRVQTSATCGLRLEVVFPPILVLRPTGQATFRVNGTSHAVTIYGGPQRGIQVNSNDTGSNPAASLPSGCSKVMLDLSLGGPSHTGSDVGVFGGPANTPCSYATGATGRWLSPAAPIGDPLQLTAAPASKPAAGTIVPKAAGVDGCPATAVGGCDLYLPGSYDSGINVTGRNALFAPGLYWVEKGFDIKSNSCVRPLDTSVFSAGDGSGGTTFYFADDDSINVIAGAGDCVGTGMPTYDINSSKCDSATQLPGGPTPTTFSGTVLLGPCTGTYGDPQGTSNPAGMQHGILFFQNRTTNPSGGKAPDWHGGGNFLLGGTLYFHQCRTTSGSDANGVGCSSSAYNTQFTFQADDVLAGVLIGNIIADELTVGGNLILNIVPGAGQYGIKASLMR